LPSPKGVAQTIIFKYWLLFTKLVLMLALFAFPHFGYVDWHTFWFVFYAGFIFRGIMITEVLAKIEQREKSEKP